MAKKDLFIPINLQFFAEDISDGDEDAGANVEDVADPQTEDDAGQSDEGVNEEPTEPQFDSDRANAAFASMRRELEAAKRQQEEIDAMYARQYGGYTNPETGRPIASARDYFEAMAAQERMQMRAQLQESNIDPRVIDNMIANSPAVRQAQAVTAELNSYRAEQMMSEDFKKILAFDTTKSSEADIINDPSYNAVVGYVQSHPGMRFDEAYKLVNFDRLANSKGAAAKQAAINEVKSKNHLSTGTSVDVGGAEEEIPASQITQWKEWFPEKSMKELKSLYNKARR